MTHIPTDLVSYGSYNSLSHRSRTPVNGDGGSASSHKHSGGHHNPHPQYYYQPHHTSCKKVALQGRGHCRHRRKSSSSTLPDSIIHRRDTDSSSVRGSESCIYEPLHVDVSSPSTANNTVILTPSKITIERNHGEQQHMVRDTSSSDLPEYVYTQSPVKWHFPAERIDKKPSKDTDYIEVVSEPECSTVRDDKEVKKFTYDSKTISVWRTDNEETTNTVIFHHESEAVENCCDNYYFHCKADGEIENCSGISCEFISANNVDCCDHILDNANDNSPAKQIESLNNMVAISSYPTTPLINFHKNNISTLSTRLDLSPELRRFSKFTNLQQQNDTNLTPHHFPLGNQNASSSGGAMPNGNTNINQNLECNYFSDNKFVNTMRDGSRNQQQPQQQQPNQQSTQVYSPGHPQINSESSYYMQTNQNAFELFNISNSTQYEKPFGSINLTTQNQFEPFSNRGQSGNNNGNGSNHNNNNNNNETSDVQINREYNAGQASETVNMRSDGGNSRINTDNGDRFGGEANGLSDAGGNNSNGVRRAGAGDDDADGANNNHAVNTRDESLLSRLLSRRRHLGLGGLFREVRKRARKYTDNNRKDT